MEKQSKDIPVNTLPSGTREGIIIMKNYFHGLPNTKEVERPHRDNGHVFILQEKGTTAIEIDFQKHNIEASSILYIHPDQIHRLMDFDQATITSWIMTSENLNQENLDLLESLRPVQALALDADTFALISETTSLCIKFSERKQEKLFAAILKESFNTLVTLVASQYLCQSKNTDNYSRFEAVTKSFKQELEQNFIRIKAPAAYAAKLNISSPYLNECVKKATGNPVSYHIQQRVVLEASRLLYHSNKSIKEIAGQLGYTDYSYFTRLFVKITGTTPVVFRTKNFD